MSESIIFLLCNIANRTDELAESVAVASAQLMFTFHFALILSRVSIHRDIVWIWCFFYQRVFCLRLQNAGYGLTSFVWLHCFPHYIQFIFCSSFLCSYTLLYDAIRVSEAEGFVIAHMAGKNVIALSRKTPFALWHVVGFGGNCARAS